MRFCSRLDLFWIELSELLITNRVHNIIKYNYSLSRADCIYEVNLRIILNSLTESVYCSITCSNCGH